MTKDFQPPEEQIYVCCKITQREASLLSHLRKVAHGKFVVHKFNSLIIRVEKQGSNLIKPTDKITLETI